MHIAYSYAAQVVGVLCNFAGLILVARMAGAAGQGDLGLYNSFTAFFCLVLGLGIPSALVHFMASGKLQRPHLPRLLLIFLVGPYLLISILLWLLHTVGYLHVFVPDFIQQSSGAMLQLLLYSGVMMGNQYLQALLQAEQRFRSVALTGMLGSMILLLSYAAYHFQLMPRFSSPMSWITGSLLFVALLQGLLYVLQVYKKSDVPERAASLSPVPYRNLMLFASSAFIANLVQFLNYKMDLWFIRHLEASRAELGIYVLAVSLTQLLWLLPGAVHQVLFTHHSANVSMTDKITRTEKSSMWLLLYGVAGGGCGYLLSFYIVPAWFGTEFARVPELIGILLLGAIPISGALALSAFFAGIQKVSLNLKGSLIGLLVCLAGDVLLIPRYGITGAAWATVFSYTATALFYYLLFYRLKKQYSGRTDA